MENNMKEPECKVCGSKNVIYNHEEQVYTEIVIFLKGDPEGKVIDLCKEHYKEVCKLLNIKE
jgi:hypothetical protein